MRAHLKLGRVFGIEIGLHYSWLIIALLITFSLASHFRLSDPNWSAAVVWGSAVVTSVLFFACLLAHEISHALVARSRQLPVRGITLFALGGVTQIEQDTPDAKTEFWMAIAGPITSLVIGVALLAIARGGGWIPGVAPQTPSLAILLWLGYINIALGVFNMVPGFPLDGGRVLRAIAWWITGNAQRATRIAARVGQAVGILMILYGIFRFFGGAGLGGLWLSFIGWFLLQAAGASQLQADATALLKDLSAKDLMSRDCVILDASLTVQQFVDEQLLRTARRCFVVTDHGRMIGMLTPHDVRNLDRSRWPVTQVRDIMRPMDKVRFISPQTPVLTAMQLMASEDLNQLPVVSDRSLEGVLSRDSILHVLHSRAELKAA